MGLANPALLQVPLRRGPEILRHLDQGTSRSKHLVQLGEQPDHLVEGDPRIQSRRESRGQRLSARRRIELERQLAAGEDHPDPEHRGGETSAHGAGGRQCETGQDGEEARSHNPARGRPRHLPAEGQGEGPEPDRDRRDQEGRQCAGPERDQRHPESGDSEKRSDETGVHFAAPPSPAGEEDGPARVAMSSQNDSAFVIWIPGERVRITPR